MNRTYATSLYLLIISMSASVFAEDLDLEPCINGEVSSTGLFTTQTLEDQAIAPADEPRIKDSLVPLNQDLSDL